MAKPSIQTVSVYVGVIAGLLTIAFVAYQFYTTQQAAQTTSDTTSSSSAGSQIGSLIDEIAPFGS